jgi:hypothetical protein
MPTSTRILIATPAYNGLVMTGYAQSLVETINVLQVMGIGHEYLTFSVSDIESARNYLSSRMVNRKEFTHILFLDADMKFGANLIRKMLLFDAPFVSTIYAKRDLPLDRILRDFSEHSDSEIKNVIYRNMEYVGMFPRKDGAFEFFLKNGFASVTRTGMGICLIRRDVFDTLLQRKICGLVADSGDIFKTDMPIYDFFDRISDQGHRISEDYSFCKKWVDQCSGEIWANVDEYIEHVGMFEYGGVYLEKLKHNLIKFERR